MTLPIVLETPQGAIKGITVNISVSGFAVILFSVKPEIDDEFEITLKPTAARGILVTCKILWSRNISPYENAYYGIGVQFKKISPGDRDIIASLVSEYDLIRMEREG